MKCTFQVHIKGSNVPRFRQCRREAEEGTCLCHTHSEKGEAERRERKEERFEKNRAYKLALYLAKLKKKVRS